MLERALLSTFMLASAIVAANASPLGGPTCPTTWTYDGKMVKLRWAEVWVGRESLAPIEGLTRDGKDWQEPEPSRQPNRSRELDEAIWLMKNFKQPAFLRCMYSNGMVVSEGPDVIVPIPDDAEKCHTSWRYSAGTTYVTAISCSPGVAPVPPLSVVEPLTPQTELDGLTLRRSRADLEARTAARGAVWAESSGGNSAEVTFPDTGARYRITFAPPTGLSREIALIGPIFSGRYDFIVAVQRRFGVYNLGPWKGVGEVQIEYFNGYVEGKQRLPQEMRLQDTAQQGRH